MNSQEKQLVIRKYSILKINILQSLTEWFYENKLLVRELKTAKDFLEGGNEKHQIVTYYKKRIRRYQGGMQDVSMNL